MASGLQADKEEHFTLFIVTSLNKKPVHQVGLLVCTLLLQEGCFCNAAIAVAD